MNETAFESLIAGAYSHFVQLSRLDIMDPGVQGRIEQLDKHTRSVYNHLQLTAVHWIFLDKILVTKDVLSDLSAETIDRKAKASVIFNRVRDHPSPSHCIETVMRQLQEYIETTRSEALVSPIPGLSLQRLTKSQAFNDVITIVQTRIC